MAKIFSALGHAAPPPPVPDRRGEGSCSAWLDGVNEVEDLHAKRTAQSQLYLLGRAIAGLGHSTLPSLQGSTMP